MNSRMRGFQELKSVGLPVTAMVTSVSLVFAWFLLGPGTRIALAQTDDTLAIGYAHGTAGFVGATANEVVDASETVLVFTSAKGVRFLALVDRKGDYRVPLEAGQYCVSAYTSRGAAQQLSPQQQKCIDVSARKDVRLDVMISRTVAPEHVSSQYTVELTGEIEAQVLAGKIVDAARSPIPGVLVEQLSPDGKRVEAVLTDSKGAFVMKPRAPWVYALRASKPGFDALLVKVRVSKNGKRELVLTLPLSH